MEGPESLGGLGIAPRVTAETERFWAEAAEGHFVAERCSGCGLHVFPPRGVCRRCGGRQLGWVRVEGAGTLYSFTINHHPWLPGLAVPYGLALVEFPDYSGIRLLGRVAPADVDRLSIGAAVTLAFPLDANGRPVPTFSLPAPEAR